MTTSPSSGPFAVCMKHDAWQLTAWQKMTKHADRGFESRFSLASMQAWTRTLSRAEVRGSDFTQADAISGERLCFVCKWLCFAFAFADCRDCRWPWSLSFSIMQQMTPKKKKKPAPRKQYKSSTYPAENSHALSPTPPLLRNQCQRGHCSGWPGSSVQICTHRLAAKLVTPKCMYLYRIILGVPPTTLRCRRAITTTVWQLMGRLLWSVDHRLCPRQCGSVMVTSLIGGYMVVSIWYTNIQQYTILMQQYTIWMVC